MPLENDSARPPSRAPTTSSRASQVGFDVRPYATGPPAWNLELSTTGTLTGASGALAGRPAATTMLSGDREAKESGLLTAPTLAVRRDARLVVTSGGAMGEWPGRKVAL